MVTQRFTYRISSIVHCFFCIDCCSQMSHVDDRKTQCRVTPFRPHGPCDTMPHYRLVIQFSLRIQIFRIFLCYMYFIFSNCCNKHGPWKPVPFTDWASWPVVASINKHLFTLQKAIGLTRQTHEDRAVVSVLIECLYSDFFNKSKFEIK